MRHSQLEFDFDRVQPVDASRSVDGVGRASCAPVACGTTAPAGALTGRQRRGQTAYLSGLAAEGCVERDFAARGYQLVDRRWRGPGGEIDLVLRRGRQIVFVEVKAARTHDAAAARITHRQAGRIARSSEAFLGTQQPGSVTDMRIDVALVDRSGRVAVLENAFAGWC